MTELILWHRMRVVRRLNWIWVRLYGCDDYSGV